MLLFILVPFIYSPHLSAQQKICLWLIELKSDSRFKDLFCHLLPCEPLGSSVAGIPPTLGFGLKASPTLCFDILVGVRPFQTKYHNHAQMHDPVVLVPPATQESPSEIS